MHSVSKTDLTNISISTIREADASGDPETAYLLEPSNYGDLPLCSAAETWKLPVEALEEDVLPQGRHLGLFSTIVIFIARIVGSGIFATPGSMFNDVGGSPWLFLLCWLISEVLAFAGLYIFLEFGTLVKRNGGTKVFLEYIYSNQKTLISMVFGVYSVLFGVVISNSLVFGKYLLYAFDIDTNDRNVRLTAFILTLTVTMFHGFYTKAGIIAQNIMGGLKLLLLAIMIICGTYVVCLPTSITGLEKHLSKEVFFKMPDSTNVTLLGSALLKAIFSCSGWNSVHTIQGEIKDPIRTMKISGPVSLAVIFLMYNIINVAYLDAIPHEDIRQSGELVGSLLFEKLFGKILGKMILTCSIAISACGNVFVVSYTIARMNQEVFREDFLPFSRIFASNRPFGTPLPALLLSFVLTASLLLFLPYGDLYSYIVSVEGVVGQFFVLLVAIGIFIVRKRDPDVRGQIRASLTGTGLVIIVSFVIILVPLIFPKVTVPGLLPYSYMGLLILFAIAGLWFIRFIALPWIGGYELLQQEVTLEDGLIIWKWIKV